MLVCTLGGADGGTGGADGGTGGADGGTGGGSVDKNGVAYLPIDGFRYVGERFDWTQNFTLRGHAPRLHGRSDEDDQPG